MSTLTQQAYADLMAEGTSGTKVETVVKRVLRLVNIIPKRLPKRTTTSRIRNGVPAGGVNWMSESGDASVNKSISESLSK